MKIANTFFHPNKWNVSFLVVIVFFISSCSPQHNYAFQQFNVETSDVIVSIQGYVIDESKVETLKKNWNTLAKEMSKKPGFVSSYLNRGVGDSRLILAHSEWKDLKSLRDAFSDPVILSLEAKLYKKQFEHLFSKGSLGSYQKIK